MLYISYCPTSDCSTSCFPILFLGKHKSRHASRYHKGIDHMVVRAVIVTHYWKCNYTLHARAA